MSVLSLRLTTKASGLKGRLAVECSTKIEGKAPRRHYKIVSDLISPVFTPEYWNEKNGLFISGQYAAQNNQVVKTFLDELQALLDSGAYVDGRQLFDAYEASKNGSTSASEMTLGCFIEKLVAEMKLEQRSSNFELYNTLLNTLMGVNKKVKGKERKFPAAFYGGVRLVDTPLRIISNKHFIAFGDWIKRTKNGAGYKNLMTTFKAVISKAHQQELTENILTYKFKDHAPVKQVEDMTAKQRIMSHGQNITILSNEEFEAFERFDIKTIAPYQKRFKELAELYKDTVLLMYYTRSRPADVVSFRHGKEYDEDSHTLIYTPRKLVSRRTSNGAPRCVTIQLTQQAIDIIEKYKGKSAAGYLLPLPMNDKAWDISKEFNTWYIRVKNVEQRINAYLKKIALALNFDVSDLSMYDFRHSAITHAIRAGENVFTVAQQAGTSVVNIENHYYNSIR